MTTTTTTTLPSARANVHCRKRSFEIALSNDPQLPPAPAPPLRIAPPRHLRHGPSPRSMSFPITSSDFGTSKRRLRTIPHAHAHNHVHAPSMPGHSSSVMSTNYPSFMSVYGSDETAYNLESVESPYDVRKEQIVHLPHSKNQSTSSDNHAIAFPIYHRGSIASLATASTASSPTTAHSSPLFTDPSPSSSPESASSNPPMSMFKDIMQHSNHDRPHTSDQTDPSLQPPFTLQPQSDSPVNSNPNRNPKNLTINMSNVVIPRPATSGSIDTRQHFSEPTSPLKEPLRSARKKPTNLTIRTPVFNQLNFPRTTPDVPPTPGSKPSLQTFQSSPSLLSLATPTTNSSGALHLSLPSFSNGHSRPGSDSSVSSHSVSVNGALPGLKEEDEARRSQEVQERGYPEGPVLIYDCGLYLYLEPTAEEASRFDTVINVAKEVKNPFELTAIPSRSIVSVMRGDAAQPDTPEPATAASEISFKSAWEFQPIGEATPTAARPDSFLFRREPEYLHVAWDHNSEVLQDLYPLCEVINERTQQGKKVLVHCQLGVSRSASLVIAFGLYKGYQPDFHSMYTEVKSRSQWVGPNMSLIYQLNEFRGKITRGEFRDNKKLPPAHWFQNSFSPAVRAPFQSLSIQNDEPNVTETLLDDPAKTPQATKPLRSLKLDKELPPVPLFPKNEKAEADPHKPIKPVNSHEDAIQSISRQVSLIARQNSSKQAAQSRPLPFRKLAGYSNPQTIPPHRPRPAVPPVLSLVRPPSQIMDLAGSEDVPQTPSLFSPRATEFMASPFGLSRAVGDLATNGPKSARSIRSIDPPAQPETILSSKSELESLPSVVDPRSPHQHSDNGEILRHIDDFL